MRSETVRVLLSLVVMMALFVLAFPILTCALIGLAFSIVAAGGAFALELIHSLPGVDSGHHLTINGLPPFLQVILAGVAVLAAIGIFLSPVLISILLVARSFRVVCIASLSSLALVIVCAAVLFPFLGADFFLNGRNAGEIVFYFAATAILHAAVAGLSYYDLRRSVGPVKPLPEHSAAV